MTFNIELRWNDIYDSEGNALEDIPRELEDRLKEHGAERANELISQGYREGELIYEDERNYARGWWAVSKED